MLRLLIKDITVNKLVEQSSSSVHIRWHGGACTDLSVQIPPSAVGRGSLSFSDCRSHPKPGGGSLLDAQIGRPTQSRRLHECEGKSFYCENDSVDPLALFRFRLQGSRSRGVDCSTKSAKQVRLLADGVVLLLGRAQRDPSTAASNSGMPCWITLTAVDKAKTARLGAQTSKGFKRYPERDWRRCIMKAPSECPIGAPRRRLRDLHPFFTGCVCRFR